MNIWRRGAHAKQQGCGGTATGSSGDDKGEECGDDREGDEDEKGVAPGVSMTSQTAEWVCILKWEWGKEQGKEKEVLLWRSIGLWVVHSM